MGDVPTLNMATWPFGKWWSAIQTKLLNSKKFWQLVPDSIIFQCQDTQTAQTSFGQVEEHQFKDEPTIVKLDILRDMLRWRWQTKTLTMPQIPGPFAMYVDLCHITITTYLSVRVPPVASG